MSSFFSGSFALRWLGAQDSSSIARCTSLTARASLLLAIVTISATSFSLASDVNINISGEDSFANVIVHSTPGGETPFEHYVEYNAGMPYVPPGLAGVTFGPVYSDSDDQIVHVAGPLTLTSGRNANDYMRAEELRQAARLFVQWLNIERNGLRVGNETYRMSVSFVDDQGSEALVANATAWATRESGANFVLGGRGPTLTRYSALQSRLDGDIMLSATTSASDIFEESNGTLFGLMPPLDQGPTLLFNSILHFADKIDARSSEAGIPNACGRGGCRESLRLGTLGACSPTDLQVGEKLFEKPAYGHPLPPLPHEDELTAALKGMQTKRVTVLKVCQFDMEAIQLLTSIMEENHFDVLALLVEGVATPAFAWKALAGWWQGSYILDVVAWTKVYPVRGMFSNWTSQEFVSRFEASTGVFPTAEGAAQFAALCTLAAAIEAADSLEVEEVTAQLKNLVLHEFYGNISFDKLGQCQKTYMVLQFPIVTAEKTSMDVDAQIVYPEFAAQSNFVFPKPTWAQQRCHYHTRGCSGHGTCNSEGVCECTDSRHFSGPNCQEVEVHLSASNSLTALFVGLAAFGAVSVLLATWSAIMIVVRRRRKRIKRLVTGLEQAVRSEDEERRKAAIFELRALGWSFFQVDDQVGALRRKISEESGVSLAYLLSSDFLELAQSRSGMEDPTFYDLKDVFFFGANAIGAEQVCPRDGGRGCALVDALPRRHRGSCTHFLSWTWGYRVSTVRAALQHWLDMSLEGTRAEEVFLYMCFFVNNQYRILVNNEKTGAEDLEGVFQQNLIRIGHVVAVLDTWDNPRYLTRIWTIFEQVISIKLNIPVTMVLPYQASLELLQEFDRGKEGILRVKNSLTQVNSEEARAYAAEDECLVKELISRDLGFKQVDERIVQFMIRWIGAVMEAHMKKLVDGSNPDCPPLPDLPSKATVVSMCSSPSPPSPSVFDVQIGGHADVHIGSSSPHSRRSRYATMV